MWMKQWDGFRIKGRQTVMIPSCWGKPRLSFLRDVCCLRAWFHFHTHVPLLTDSFHLSSCHIWSATFSFFSHFLCSLLFPICHFFRTVSGLIFSWSHFPHHATIQSRPCSTLFSASLLSSGNRVAACSAVTQGQAENELVKYDRQLESFLFQEYI